MNIDRKFLPSLLLYIIEYAQDKMSINVYTGDDNQVLESYAVYDNIRVRSSQCMGDKSTCVNSRTHDHSTRQLQKIHRCKMDYLYHLRFDDGRETILTKDHPLITNTHGTFTLETYGISAHASFFHRFVDTSYMNIFIKNIDGGVSKLMSVERSYFPMMTYDVSVSCDHLYFSDGLLNHNCVTSETLIDVRVSDNTFSIPISDLFYANKKRLTFIDKIIRFLFRLKRTL